VLDIEVGQRDKDGTLGSTDQMHKPLKNKQPDSDTILKRLEVVKYLSA